MPYRARFVTGLVLFAAGLLHAVLPFDRIGDGSVVAAVLVPVALIGPGVALLLRVGLLRRRILAAEEQA